MADGVDIDLYANIEEDFNQDTEFGSHGDDLYDDVITASASGDGLESNNHSQKPPSSTISVSSIPANYTGKKYNLYVGNLTWWTTDQDLTDALTTIGVHDLLEIKFFENRANGQSKGFALVVVGSDGSSRAIFDKLSRKEIHGQVPQVTPYSRHALNQLEAASRKGGEGPPQSNNNRGFQNRQEHFGDKSPRGGSRPPTPNNPGKPHFQPRGQPRGPPMPNQGPPPQGPPTGPPPGFAPVRPGGPPPGIPPPGSMPPGAPQMRGPPPSMPRMGPGPPPQLRGPPGMHDPRRPPPLRPDWNPRVPEPIDANGQPLPPGTPFHNAGPPPPQPVPPPGLRPPMSGPPQMPPVSGGPPPGHMPHPGGPPAPSPHVNPAFFPPPHARAPPPGQIVNIPTGDPYGRPPPNSYPPSDSPYGRPSERHEPPPPALSEQEFEEIFQRNKTVSSSAINRAVQDASAGDFASAIETLVTAISLIKQSKIAGDDRCKILISSLQDTLHGIEEKSYGSKSASSTRRSRSRSRERDREREKRSRHRSRSRDRDYERNRERERHYEERHRSDRGERSERERERSEREYAGSSSSSSRRH